MPVSGRDSRSAALDLDFSPSGKHYNHANWDITATVQVFRYYAGWADKDSGKTMEVRGLFLTTPTERPDNAIFWSAGERDQVCVH